MSEKGSGQSTSAGHWCAKTGCGGLGDSGSKSLGTSERSWDACPNTVSDCERCETMVLVCYAHASPLSVKPLLYCASAGSDPFVALIRFSGDAVQP